jgi:hypothetical protein
MYTSGVLWVARLYAFLAIYLSKKEKKNLGGADWQILIHGSLKMICGGFVFKALLK